VLDVHTNPANPVIGDRALADDPALAARLGAAVIRGLQLGGVAACGKHFPGHGDTHVDSHEALPIVEHDRKRLDAIEFVPFRRAIAEGVATIMTAHVMVPAIDERNVASFSPQVVTGLLKQHLGFAGVVISDDLDMKAVSSTTASTDATVRAIKAGCDVVLLCNSTPDAQWQAIEALIRAVEQGEISWSRLDDAMLRQKRMKERFAASMAPAATAFRLETVGRAEHLAIAREMSAWR
jgi:beta-N-acetylhexosaminidase